MRYLAWFEVVIEKKHCFNTPLGHLYIFFGLDGFKEGYQSRARMLSCLGKNVGERGWEELKEGGKYDQNALYKILKELI